MNPLRVADPWGGTTIELLTKASERNGRRAEPTRRAVVEALVKASEPNEVVAYFCVNCGTIYTDAQGTGKEDAERCAHLRNCTEWSCRECGQSAPAHMNECLVCGSRRRAKEWTEKIIAEAEIVEDYPDDQPVYWDHEYYRCIGDLIKHCETNGLDIPSRVWATTQRFFNLRADAVLATALGTAFDPIRKKRPAKRPKRHKTRADG